MDFSVKEIRIKDGRTCTLRPAAPEDAAAMIEYMKITAGETPFLLRYPDEVSFTPEGERELLAGVLADPRSAMMIAEVDGRIAGVASFSEMGKKRKLRHRCGFAIALYREFHRLGVGTAMIGYLSGLAGQTGYEQMDLEVYEDNAAAIALYGKCGFTETGRLHHAVKLDDDSYRDYLIMYKPLSM